MNLDDSCLNSILKNIRDTFGNCILTWYSKHGRNFFWRNTNLSSWHWLVLEVLLKRTRAEAVNKILPDFLTKYSEPQKIKKVKIHELENDLKILGLQKQRTYALKKIANIILDEYDGIIPVKVNTLKTLPYIGQYTSNAISCFSQNARVPLVDTNILRIFTRVLGLKPVSDIRNKTLWSIAQKLLPEENYQNYNYGLIDFGAKVCKSSNPVCVSCCLNKICAHIN